MINLLFLISGDYGHAVVGPEFALNISAIYFESQEEDEDVVLRLKDGWI